MKLTIIDYGSGNLRSVAKSLAAAAGGESGVTVTSDPGQLADATHIVLPGVGAFADCIAGLTAIAGMRDVLEKEVRGKRKPFLGICVGMQMLFDTGYEHGIHAGLGWLAGEVVKIGMTGEQTADDHPSSAYPLSLKIPHMGWNELNLLQPSHPLVNKLKTGDHAYFVHSYHACCNDASDIVATTDYGAHITAIVARGNIMGAQFHPEKSQDAGLQLLRNFLNMQ